MRRPHPAAWVASLLLAIAPSGVAFASESDATGVGLSRNERTLVAWIDGQTEAQIRDLEELVNINSGSTNLDGVRRVGEFFSSSLKDLGFDVTWVDMPPQMQRAGHLVARRSGSRGKRLLLIGHLDTVFPPDSPFQRFQRSGDRITGPGADDMKDGDLVMLYALRALQYAGLLKDTSITVALMGDEEAPGEPTEVSRAALIDAARSSDVALGFESGYNQSATIGRRGASGWTISVHGKRAHSASILGADTGAGASYELARIVDEVRRRIGSDPALTINPAVLLSGTDVEFDGEEFRGAASGKANIVADAAIAAGDMRYLTPGQGEDARKMIRDVVDHALTHTGATVEFREYYPPMAPTDGNRALHRMYSEISESIGAGPVRENDPVRTGAADISFVAAHVDCLDGLGSWGGANHSTEEYLEAGSLRIATARAAIMIYRLTR